jgi:hypothetical protein
MSIRLGDLLVCRGVLSEEQRDSVLERQMGTGRPFGLLAEEMFGVGPRCVEEAWAEQYALLAPCVDPRDETVEPEALRLVDARQGWQFGVLPMRFDGMEVVVATTPENLVRALRFLGWKIGASCLVVLSQPGSLREAMMRHYPMPGAPGARSPAAAARG